jgi:hypothetical protein
MSTDRKGSALNRAEIVGNDPLNWQENSGTRTLSREESCVASLLAAAEAHTRDTRVRCRPEGNPA